MESKNINIRYLRFIILFVIMSKAGCFQSFEISEIPMGEYKLRDGNVLTVKYFGGGATTTMGIRVFQKKTNELIDELRGFDNTYIISFDQINDSILKLSLKETAYFKGQITERVINLNKRIK